MWDGAVVGFGARRQRGDAISFVLSYRTATGRKRHLTIGRHGSPWTPETARAEALRLLAIVAAGGDPIAEREARRAAATTVAALCDRYMADAEAGRLLTRRRTAKKASTLYADRGRIERHIKPLLGRLPVAAVTRADVEDLMHRVAAGATRARIKTRKQGLAVVRGGRGTASRTVGLLGAIFAYAVRRGLRPDNPVRGVVRPADGRRERRLRPEEYAALGAGLMAAEDDVEVWPPALAAIRFLAVTGWRRGEVLGLQWSEIDLARRTARLSDSKSGASLRPLSEAACAILRSLPRNGGTVVFPGPGGGPMGGFRRSWARVVHRIAGLPEDITPHVLRHSFASLAADLGHADAVIGALLGHKGHSVTRRYVHCADAALIAAADTVAEETIRLMAPEK